CSGATKEALDPRKRWNGLDTEHFDIRDSGTTQRINQLVLKHLGGTIERRTVKALVVRHNRADNRQHRLKARGDHCSVCWPRWLARVVASQTANIPQKANTSSPRCITLLWAGT